MSIRSIFTQKRDIPMVAEENQSRAGAGQSNDLPDLPRAPEAEKAKPEVGPEGYRVGDRVDYVDPLGTRFKSLPIQKFAGKPNKVTGKRPYVHIGTPDTIEFVLKLSDITPTRRREGGGIKPEDM